MPNSSVAPDDTGHTDAPVGVASQLTGIWKGLFQVPAVALGLFALWSAGPGIAEDHIHLGVYTLVTWVLALLVLPMRDGTRWSPPDLRAFAYAGAIIAGVAVTVFRLDTVEADGAGLIDWLAWALAGGAAILSFRHEKATDLSLIGLAGLTLGYYMVNYAEIVDRAGAWTKIDLGFAAVSVVLALEVARRAIGPWIPGIALFAIAYAYFGAYFPEAVAHRGAGMERILDYTFYSQEGIFGIMTTVMAQYVLIFIFLGAFMQSSGMGKFFIEFPLTIAGRSAGGPAKVAVLASAVFGSISGSSLANIVSTGTFTIPLMKRVGFRATVAGAVENSASLGGQLLPPVMGSGVFIMAEITGVPYVDIIAIAAVPALLYLLSIGMIVHFEAKKNGIEGLPESELRRPGAVFRAGWYHLVPFAILLAFLIVGYSPDWCAVMAIGSILIINWTRGILAKFGVGGMPDEIMGPRVIFQTLITGTRNSLLVGGAAGAVGVIVGMIAMTGLGLKMSLILVDLSGGSVLLAVLLVALTSLLMGMALPITASYLVLVVLAGPALEQLGVAVIAAHLIVFWLSQDSNITPPVCLGAFVAASIAQGDPWKTGWMSFRFAKMLYIMPLLFAFTPILDFSNPLGAVWTMVTASVGTLAFACWTMSFFRRRATWTEWGLLAVAAIFCFLPFDLNLFADLQGYAANIAGAALLAGVYAWQRFSPKATGSA